MGAVCGSTMQTRSQLSVTGKRVKSTYTITSRFLLNDQKYTIYSANESLLYSALNRELTRRLKDTSLFANKEFEFVDVRPRQAFKQLHLLLFMNIDLQQDQTFLNDDKTQKNIFDFKDIFFIAPTAEATAGKTSSEAPHELKIDTSIRTVLKKFNENNVKLQNVYILRVPVEKFAKDYTFFQHNSSNQSYEIPDQMQGVIYPLQIYDHSELCEQVQWQQQANSDQTTVPNTNFKLYLSSYQIAEQNLAKDKQFAEKLGVTALLYTKTGKRIEALQQSKTMTTLDFMRPNNDEENQKAKEGFLQQLWQNLKGAKNTLILHDQDQRDSGLQCINLVKSFLYEKLHIFEAQIHDYMAIRFSKNVTRKIQEMSAADAGVVVPEVVVVAATAAGTSQSNGNGTSQIQKILGDLSRDEEIAQNFQLLYKECDKKQQIIEEFRELASKLIDNIVNNASEQKYRTLQKNNKNLQQKAFKYKGAVKILELCGFTQSGEVFVNNLEAKYLKLAKADIGVGYSKFMQTKK